MVVSSSSSVSTSATCLATLSSSSISGNCLRSSPLIFRPALGGILLLQLLPQRGNHFLELSLLLAGRAACLLNLRLVLELRPLQLLPQRDHRAPELHDLVMGI